MAKKLVRTGTLELDESLHGVNINDVGEVLNRKVVEYCDRMGVQYYVARLVVEHGWDGFDYCIEVLRPETQEEEFTREAHEQRRREARAKAAATRRKRLEAKERAEYEKLRKKYGST